MVVLFCTARAPCHKVKRTERGGRVSTLDAVAYPSLVDTSRHHITTTTSPTHPPTALQSHSRRPVQCAYCRRPVFRHPPVIYRRRLPSRPRPAHRRARRVVLLSLHSFQGRQFAARTPTHAHANAHSPRTRTRLVQAHTPTPTRTHLPTVLLVGCGDGRAVVHAARHFGIRCVGVDIDESCVRQSKQLVR